MKKGGGLNQNTTRVFRAVGLLAPILLFMYGWLVPAGFLSDEHYIGVGWFVFISAIWIVVGIYQYLRPAKTLKLLYVYIILYHLLAIAYILLVTGLTVALVSGWALLLLMSYLHFSSTGFIISASILQLLAAVDIGYRSYDIVEMINIMVSIIIMVLVGLVAIKLGSVNSNESQDLKASQKREAIERERILTIINNLADPVFSTDKEGKIQIYNAAGLGLLDTNLDINNRSIDEVFILKDAEGKKVSLFSLIKTSRTVTINDELRMKNGEEDIRLEFTYAPIRASYSSSNSSETEEGFILIARDVTRLKSLGEERDEFISVVSHELRTPIAVAEGSISNAQLMMERGMSDTGKISDSLTEAHEQVVYLAKMINDLSTLSRAERGVASETEDIDVTAMAHDLYNEYSPEAEKEGLHLNLELSPKLGHVQTSRLYLHELLQNFITNSIKYTKDGSVTLKISQKEGLIHFAVSDTGIGISKSDQAKVFDKFYRSEDYRTRETGGTGLGLYVSAKLSRKIDTTIELKSRINHGSTFSFALPASKKNNL